MRRSLLTFTLIVQLAVSTAAQQPAPTPAPDPASDQTKPQATQQTPRSTDDDVVRVTTNLVQVDAVITDKKGKLVTDLREDEIEIRQDSKPQPITNFSFVSLEPSKLGTESKPGTKPDKTLPPLPPVRLSPEQVRRTIALVVDDLGLSFESTYFVRRALKKFLDEQMQPDDLVAIIQTGGGMGVLQQFTSDKRQLYAAYEKVKWNPTGLGQIAAIAPISDNPIQRAEDARGGDREISEDFDQFREDLFAAGTLGAIGYVVRGMRELPGRKSVMLISDGITIFNSSNPGRSYRVLDSLRRLTALANRASVVIYTMDARGLPVLGLTAADSTAGMTPQRIEQQLSSRSLAFFNSQSGLDYLARQTGGLAVRNNNDLSLGIKRMLEDQQGYYLIGYRPDESTFETVSGRPKFHSLSLKVKRPGKFNVRIRNGFFGVTDEAAVPAKRTAAQQMLAALTSPFGSAGVRLKLTSLFANTQERGSIVRSLLYVDARDLSFIDEPDGWHKAVFDIVAITFGDKGIVDQVSRTHTMRARGEVYDRIMKEGFVYPVLVPVKKSGGYQLRAALRDTASERVGSASQFVEVPDVKKNRLTLSGVLVRGMSPEVYKKRVSSLSNQPDADGQTDDTDPMAGAAVRQFRSGYVMEYAFFVYNAQIDKATGKSNVHGQIRLFQNGQQVFAGKEFPVSSEQPDLKRLAATGGLQLGTEMLPGEYVLQVVVTDPLAKEKRRVATQWIDFEILK